MAWRTTEVFLILGIVMGGGALAYDRWHRVMAPASAEVPGRAFHLRICEEHCACLFAQCSTQSGFPFADLTACNTWCGGQRPAERMCWHAFCLEIPKMQGTGHLRVHDHATRSLPSPSGVPAHATEGDGSPSSEQFFDRDRLADAAPVIQHFHLCEHAWGAFDLQECDLLVTP